jgi:hypothetical protein
MHGVQTPHCYTDMSSKRYGRKSKVPVIKWKHKLPEPMQCNKGSAKVKVCIYECLC